MHFSLSTILISLSLSASVLASPTDPKSTRIVERRKLKQATRDSVVTRARNPFRRQAATSCGSCTDCCSGFCRSSGQVEHAVYYNTGLPSGFTRNAVATTTENSLELCIRRCCGNTVDCDLVTFVTTSGAAGTCEQYYKPDFVQPVYPTTDTPGTTVVRNQLSCAANAAESGNRACCNAPLIPSPP